jgi:hypothetical protein
MSLRKLFFYISFLLIFPLVGLVLSLILLIVWNLGFCEIFTFLPKINFIIAFIITTLITIVKTKIWG